MNIPKEINSKKEETKSISGVSKPCAETSVVIKTRI
jgi:hypothetical protein